MTAVSVSISWYAANCHDPTGEGLDAASSHKALRRRVQAAAANASPAAARAQQLGGRCCSEAAGLDSTRQDRVPAVSVSSHGTSAGRPSQRCRNHHARGRPKARHLRATPPGLGCARRHRARAPLSGMFCFVDGGPAADRSRSTLRRSLWPQAAAQSPESTGSLKAQRHTSIAASPPLPTRELASRSFGPPDPKINYGCPHSSCIAPQSPRPGAARRVSSAQPQRSNVGV